MAANFSDLLRKIFLGSMAGITATSANTLAKENNYDNDISKNYKELSKKNDKDLTPKLILKLKDNQLTFMSHRSHRSHSSHRSHYSSSSGSSSSSSRSSRSSSRSSSSSSSSSSSGNSYSNSLSSPNKTLTLPNKLGSRTLRLGMSGADVTELINILLNKNYLVIGDGTKYVTGIYTYDSVVKSAVESFQSDKGITIDGICASVTVYYLKN